MPENPGIKLYQFQEKGNSSETSGILTAAIDPISWPWCLRSILAIFCQRSQEKRNSVRVWVTKLTNRPNPSTNMTRIVFSLSEPARAVLEVHDAAGRTIAVLANGRYESGIHQVVWGGSDSSGHPVGPGVYFCRLQAEGLVANQKIVLVK